MSRRSPLPGWLALPVVLAASLPAVAESPAARAPERPIVAPAFPPGESFMRFSAEDPAALQEGIASAERQLAEARSSGNRLEALRAAGSLGSLLTTARREQEAAPLLESALKDARKEGDDEIVGFLLLNLGTAVQYLDRREEARRLFDEALGLARAKGMQVLEHYVLHHQGRLYVELGELTLARQAFEQALVIRTALNEPRAASTRRALDRLTELETKAQAAGP